MDGLDYPTWQSVGIPANFVQIIRDCSANDWLDLLVSNRIFGQPMRYQFHYRCNSCGRRSTLNRIYEDYPKCEKCNSWEISCSPNWRVGKDKIPSYTHGDASVSEILERMKNNSNITDNEFWDNKYYRGNPTYVLLDPYYGRNGLFHRKFGCFIEYNSNVLELGCGASKYLMFFKLIMGLKTYGIDFSAQGIEKLNIMANRKGIEHNIVLGDFFEVDMDERKFDLIFHDLCRNKFCNF